MSGTNSLLDSNTNNGSNSSSSSSGNNSSSNSNNCSSNSNNNSRLLRIHRIIECPICSDTLRRTAVLPCAHTFCLRCLSRYANDQGHGRSNGGMRVSCPICRKRFDLEDEKGLASLPRNFVVEGVVETLTGRSDSGSLDGEVRNCALCSEIVDRQSELGYQQHLNLATEFCRQCRHSLCAQCAAQHKLVFPLHRICPTDSTKGGRQLKRRQHAYFCSKHKKEELSFYCFHCSATTCAICRHQFHRHHDCPPISDVFDDFVDEMQFELNEVTDFCSTAEHVTRVLETYKDRVKENCENVKETILRKNGQLKHAIDTQTSQLLDQLSAIQSNRLEGLNERQDALKTRLNSLHSFVKCYERLRDVATPHDVALRITEFHEKSAILLDLAAVTDAARAARNLPRIVFENSLKDLNQYFGTITFDQKLDYLADKPNRADGLYDRIKVRISDNEFLVLLIVLTLLLIISQL